ncbi:MAG: M42 family metallopeptidase [Planctomycetota bacterium]
MPIEPPAAADFLAELLNTPSPSGYEEKIQECVRAYVDDAADSVRTDIHGNVIAVTGDPQGPRLMFAGHCDQIGMLVTHVDEMGYVYAATIGGWDPQQLIGQSMTIWSAAGPVPAAISRKAIHLLKQEERKRVVDLTDMWLDIGASDREDALSSVSIGDPITLDLGFRELKNDLISGPGMDNKTGTWVVMEAFRLAASADETLRCQIHSASTVQEEIGLRGARTAAGSIDPDVGIAVDVTHASDCPTVDKSTIGDVRLGRGPVIFRGPNVNNLLGARLVSLAEEKEIPYQVAALGRAASNDANVLQTHGGGVATGLVCVPNRYMHSGVEVISRQDIQNAAKLLSLFALSLSSEDDFTPRPSA